MNHLSRKITTNARAIGRVTLLSSSTLVIAAIALTGVAMLTLPGNLRADAQPILVEEDIEIPCLPPPDGNGCSLENEPETIDKTTPSGTRIIINPIFVPRSGEVPF
jgi:hypothetical protein